MSDIYTIENDAGGEEKESVLETEKETGIEIIETVSYEKVVSQ